MMKQLFKKYYKKIFPPKEPKYPCQECMLSLLEQGCSSLCDQVEMNEDRLREIVTEFGKCPDCGSPKFFGGPSGGLAQNVSCCGCAHKFNNGLPLFFQRI